LFFYTCQQKSFYKIRQNSTKKQEPRFGVPVARISWLVQIGPGRSAGAAVHFQEAAVPRAGAGAGVLEDHIRVFVLAPIGAGVVRLISHIEYPPLYFFELLLNSFLL